MNKPLNVNKHTRSPRNGREIVCPKCNEKHKVYHFSWTSLTCFHKGGCGADVNKQDWIIALTDKEKYTGNTYKMKKGKVIANWTEREINTKMIQDTHCDIDTSDYPDFCDSHFVEAHWIDGTTLTDEELESLTNDSSYLYECIEGQLY
jgi:hypothetical protein